jgi:type IX secretion system PorP/SprF family membrane protein
VHFVGFGQDSQYSKFYSVQLYLNPAFAGTKVCLRVILNFRDQWTGISREYVSYGLSYDKSVGKNSGIGIVFNGDDAGQGTIKTNSINLVYSPKIPLNKRLTLSFAIAGGIIQKKLDASNLTFPNQYDDKGFIIGMAPEIIDDINKITPDFNTGVILYSDLFHLGYSAHHVLDPNDILYTTLGKLYRKHTVHFGFNYIVSNKFNRKNIVKISPQIVYQQQGPHSELNLGVCVTKKKVSGGIWYRGEDAIILVVGVQTKKFNFGFSYDATLSKLANNTAGSI